ncbi:hypothetical protein BJY52DRAFT_1224092 [Lactarius psammicola]|nr:hypothetical protein BJY52DRAFT_1224092 [Lactarius psammicola]
MVNWRDPALILRDYFTLTKLLHAVGGAYIWETVFTAGFELNVLRGKQPYRWTIWYSSSSMTAVVFPARIAIWDRNVAMSSIALSTWLAGLGLNIRSAFHTPTLHTTPYIFPILCTQLSQQLGQQHTTIIEPMYDSGLESCLALKSHSGLAGAAAILAADTMLLIIMLIGLLQHAHGSSTGIWHLLYKQVTPNPFHYCPHQALKTLSVHHLDDLGANCGDTPGGFPYSRFKCRELLMAIRIDPWNQMFSSAASKRQKASPPKGSICAARMYRSLSKYGSLTEYSSDPPQFSGGLPVSNYQRNGAHSVHNAIHFRTVTQSDRILAEPFEFVPAEQIQLESIPGTSNTTLAEPARMKSKDTPGYQTSWLRPG